MPSAQTPVCQESCRDWWSAGVRNRGWRRPWVAAARGERWKKMEDPFSPKWIYHVSGGLTPSNY